MSLGRLFESPGPRWLTIPAHRPFLDDLAGAIWQELSPGGPEALADARILLPTRRAARALGDSFLKASGAKAALLPQIRVLGDLDENEPPFEAGDITLDLPPAISPWRRRFELTGLVSAHQDLLGRRLTARSALELADALAGFLDSCQIEEVDGAVAATKLAALAGGEFARHWQISATFLDLALQAWPTRLESLGLMDVAARRVALMRRLAEAWTLAPPSGVVVAAGSTGSAPASAALLTAIARAPQGCVILPGLDLDLADEAWLEVTDQHPQGAMRRLLGTAGVDRDGVLTLDPSAAAEPRGRWRRRLINEALRPPERTADWRAVIDRLRAERPGGDPIAEGLQGLSIVKAKTEEEAAALAALILRETLQTPGKTAAFICPDSTLARRVSARLLRWGIEADSSAGEPLAGARVAVLAALIAKVSIDPSDPVTQLAIVKHPLVNLGFDDDVLVQARSALERWGLRGARPGSWLVLAERLDVALTRARETGATVLIEALSAARELAEALREALALASAPFALGPTTAGDAATALTQSLERLARTPRGGMGDLWRGVGAERVGRLLSALISESGALPAVTPLGFALLLEDLLAAESQRLGGASHPRLKILGVLEARLVRADLVILAGLEEGVWPQGAPIDPLLSRPMREALGLPSPERRIGLAAHDFAQAACGPEVVLLQTERRGGSPTVASRWLWRLETLVKGAKLELPTRPEISAWARTLDGPLANPPTVLRTAARPAPTPPVSLRPRELGVTGVERWLRDPYAIYARYILRLRPLERPDEPVDARSRGVAIHRAFERFTQSHSGALPEDAAAAFAALLKASLREEGMAEARMARESALADNAALWAVDFERRRRPGAQIFVEQAGRLTLDGPGGPFRLTAKADRIEVRGDVADILDFKTGAPPSAKQVKAHIAPQLTLTAAILAAGGFEGLGPLTPRELIYVRVSGGRTPGAEERRDDAAASSLASDALVGLQRRIAEFDRPETPYTAWTMPQFIGRFGGDYDHLSRLWEWYVIGEDQGSAEGDS
jgi:ATP-dependent helicase/nuclease subunit B